MYDSWYSRTRTVRTTDGEQTETERTVLYAVPGKKREKNQYLRVAYTVFRNAAKALTRHGVEILRKFRFRPKILQDRIIARTLNVVYERNIRYVLYIVHTYSLVSTRYLLSILRVRST